MDPKLNVLVGVTGSVAAIKLEELIHLLLQSNFDVKVVATKDALRFFEKTLLSVPVYTDSDECGSWKKRGDPVLHIELRKWADIFLIAPMSANTLAKVSMGLCDNLVTCVARTWFFDDDEMPKKKYGVFAPAMNTLMWNHPLTSSQVKVLCDVLKWRMIAPITKPLICGDTGKGAMEEPCNIVNYLKSLKF